MIPPLAGAAVEDPFKLDPRPLFLVSTASADDSPEAPCVAYTNPALADHADLVEIVGSPKTNHAGLWAWIQDESRSFAYMGRYWTKYRLSETLLVVSTNDERPFTFSNREDSRSRRGSLAHNASGLSALTGSLPHHLKHHEGRRSMTPNSEPETVIQALQKSAAMEPELAPPDFMPDQEPFLDVVDSIDWASTPLGPVRNWPARLQQAFSHILADSRPIAIYWGDDYTTVYNEAFSRLCGSKHPSLLGKPVDEAWPDVAARLKEAMKTSAQKQRASLEDEWRFFVERADACPEETYLRWSIMPIIEGNTALGFMHPVLETTSMRLWERRMKMLIDLGEGLVTSRDIKSYWQKTIEELEDVEPRYDIPLAILYSVQDEQDIPADAPRTYDCTKICQLEGTLGVPSRHKISPPVLELRHSDIGLSSMFREALTDRRPLLLQTRDGSLPEHLLEGLEWRGFGDPCTEAIICPIRPTKEENVMGLLFLGLNPRRPYDNDYQQYISLLNQKLTTSLASTVLLEEEARRGRNAAQQAEYDQAMLREKLDLRTKEATEFIRRFEAVSEFIPVGMCFGDFLGDITFANDAWYRITGCQPQASGVIALQDFLSCVVEEDRDGIMKAYEGLATQNIVEFEFRVKLHESRDSEAASIQTSPSFEETPLNLIEIGGRPTERHVLASAKAEQAPDGSVVRVMTSLTDVTLHRKTAEEAVRRAQEAENLKRMAEFATVGLYDMNLDGRLVGANNVFFEMCGLDKVTDLATTVLKPWEECVVKEDLEVLEQSVARMVEEGRNQTAEIRLKVPFIAEDGGGDKFVAPRWVSATFMPVRTSEGLIHSFTGCLSDISLQKWQLDRERQRKDEAIASKRRQENFIDMTSHEMRNPLSAIIHCADAIIASLAKVEELTARHAVASVVEADHKTPVLVNGILKDSHIQKRQLISNSIENAETIIACAQHQKRIVDDILTMSKLDSKLLAVTPITVDPVHIMQEALKMFEVEARRTDINLSMAVDRSYRDLDISFLDFDPSRLKQVLINLLTNALKFTKSGPTRNVSVTLLASKARPSDATSSVQFIPPSEEQYDPDLNLVLPSRGRPDPVYLLFEVKDTGQGLTEDEKNSLFRRFVQASVRTHVEYGGSGLGLFISRRLTEMQNGAIGVASKPGVGSTFAFYIETFRPNETALREAEASAALSKRASIASMHNNLPLLPSHINTGAGKPVNGAVSAQPVQLPQAPEINGILIVEDNLINQQITRRGLSDRGYKVDIANHGVEALEKLRLSDRCPPGTVPLSLILMDIEMPVQDGLTCTRLIRQLEKEGKIAGGRIPIIAVSANARLEQMNEAKAAGCDDVLVKPYRMPELIEKMNVVVTRLRALEAEEAEEEKQQQQQQCD
ncbi:uncharacterized protein E0L32_005619 [Thyridium curvatum]|uniref:Uncharacterized protein n=1 Tax=Thyridium curvatum TaxID=1093900 RepID=A0A507B951_9PEZI|nr:uncharacterized protein E0L32_005619 [Thyridium curvatum]TPX13919.1 hypothetical protein E0L32_005619 [Thyridium curvatum]